MVDVTTAFDITDRKRAEEALKESEKKFRALAESTTAHITIIQDDKYVYGNQAFLDYHGLDDEDFELITPEEMGMGMMSEEAIRDSEKVWRAALERGDSHFRVEFPDIDGNWFQTDVTIIELDGKETYIGLTFDITEVKRAQAAIEESEKRFRALAESTSAGIAITKEDRFVYANKTMLDKYGVTWEELSNIRPHDTLTKEAHDAGHEAIEEAMARGDDKFRFEFSEKDDEGEERWYEVNASMLDIEGEKAMIWTSFDVTELKQAQQELAESEERYRTIFDIAGTAMVSFGEDKLITLANEEWCKLGGYTIAETVGKLTWMPFFTEKSLEKMRKYHDMRTKDPSSAPRAYESEFQDREGKIREGIVNIQVVPGTQQRVASFQDLTELKRAQNEMYRADKMAALGQIIAGVAHEINNPNNFIYFNLPILRKYLEAITPMLEQRLEDEPDLKILNMPYEVFLQDVFKLLENMEHGSMRITNIVADLKNYVRSDEDQDLKAEQVGQAIERVMALVGKQVRKMVRRFEVDVEDGLPAVQMNLGKIEQVLINLVINAGQAADKDDSWVKLSARLSEEHQGFVELLVADNGAGIPEENLEQIFEPFFTSKGREQGTGLGLSISHRIVEEHGGAIDVESTVGEGTVFTIRLPSA
jgi:PAS domain S-box-containing protein